MSVVAGSEPGCVLVSSAPKSGGILVAILTALFAAGTFGAALFAGLGILNGDLSLLPLPIVIGIPTLLLCWWTLAQLRARLELYEWGMIRRHAFGTVRLPFADVDTITLPGASQIGVEPLSRSRWKGGSGKLSFALLPAAEALKIGDYALQRVVPRLVADAQARIKSGGEVRFGIARAKESGLTIGNTTFSWAEIDRMNFSPEGLRIFPHNRPEATAILALGTPNLHVLINLTRARQADAPAMAAATTAPPAAYTGVPTERVAGYADVDPELGPIVCGKSRLKSVPTIALGFAVLMGLGLLTLMLHWALTIAVEIALVGFGINEAMKAGFAIYERGARFPKGMLRFDETEHLTYSVVDQYTNGAYTGRQVGLSVEGKDGVKFNYSGTGAKNEAICNAVVDRALPPLCDRRWKEVQAGGELTVDKLTLKKDRVIFKKEELALPLLLTAEPRKGFLHVWRRDKETSWATASLASKDGRVLALLVDRMFRERDAAAQSARALG